jgi:hypothetical protein
MTPEGYRHISLLTTEYNSLARIMASRLRQVLQDHLHNSQYCGVLDNSILDAISLVRDAIAYSETTASPLCVFSLDFQNAFDRISHHLKSYNDMGSANDSSSDYKPHTKMPQLQYNSKEYVPDQNQSSVQ